MMKMYLCSTISADVTTLPHSDYSETYNSLSEGDFVDFFFFPPVKAKLEKDDYQTNPLHIDLCPL